MLIESIAYDEEDDGFTFTRTRAKKAKTQPILPPTIEEQKPEERAEPSHPPKRSRKKSDTSPNTAPTESDQKTGRRRSARHSGEHENADPPPLPVKKRRKVRSSSETKPDQGGEQPPSKDSQPHNRSPRPEDPKQDHTQPIEITFDATKIALPFADTPRIQRNKDMRKTNAARRSSLGLRGRRASSLIDAGKSTGNDLLPDFGSLGRESNVKRQPCPTAKSRRLNSTNISKAKAFRNHGG